MIVVGEMENDNSVEIALVYSSVVNSTYCSMVMLVNLWFSSKHASIKIVYFET